MQDVSSSDAKCCDNHICAKHINDTKGVAIQCPLCLTAAYCSEACRYMDWVKHACPNASLVEARAPVTAFVPYFGEDTMTADELAKLPSNAPIFQAHTVDTRLPDDTLVQMRVEPIAARATFKRETVTSNTGRGVDPTNDFSKNATYQIDVKETGTGNTVQVSGTIVGDAIYDDSPVPRIKRLLGRETISPSQLAMRASNWARSKGSQLRLWPHNEEQALAKLSHFPIKGMLSVVIHDATSEHKIALEGAYDLRSAARQGELFGGLRKQMQTRLRAKFGKSQDLADMFGLRAHYLDVDVYLIMHVARGSDFAVLRDIEVAFPIRRFTASGGSLNIESMIGSGIPLQCNPRSLEDVTALAMGLELRLTKARVAKEPVNSALDNAAGVIRKHARALAQGKTIPIDAEVPMDINTAIYTAINSL